MPERTIQRPERWAIPFSDEIDYPMVQEVLQVAPFKNLDESTFRGNLKPEQILLNDAKLTTYTAGEIVVRQGDWGNSVFFVLDGSLRADLESSEEGDDSILGSQLTQRRNWFQLLAQLWNNPAGNEVRDVSKYTDRKGIKKRGSGKQTRIYLQDMSQVLNERRTAAVEKGQFFGELSALGRTPRQATVVAIRDTRLLEIRWQGFRDLMRGDSNIRTHIDEVFRERALKWFLVNTPLFQHLGEEKLAQLVEAAEFETYGKYDWFVSFKRLAGSEPDAGQLFDLEPVIARQGDHPNGLIIIRSGLARLTRQFENGQRTTSYLGPGHVFGMDEIAQGWKSSSPGALNYSLRAIGITTVVVIPTRVVEELLLETEALPQLALNRAQAAASSSPSEIQQVPTEFVEFLLQKRFVNGSATMLIDMDRCTRCDDCVRACASTHGNNPRFLRDGPIQNNVMVASACMHCEDPVCMIECPTGAIHRESSNGAVVINDQTCIGCSACANNCPYGTIRMVEIRHPDGEFIRESQTQQPIVKATKCDLCFDQLGGPACQRACPHGAMTRMDMDDTESLTAWMGNRST